MSAKRQSVDRASDALNRLIPPTRPTSDGSTSSLSEGFHLRIDPRTILEPISSENSGLDRENTPEPLHDIRATIASWGLASIQVSQALELRGRLLKAFPDRLGATTLKNADPQTMVAIESARVALEKLPENQQTFGEWGCVTAPSRPGRQKVVQVLEKYWQSGASSISPQIIPHCSLHSLAGLVAQACGWHGPNLGAGGVPGREADVFLVGLGWLMGNTVPGVWLVIVQEDGPRISALTLGLNRSTTVSNLRIRPVGSGETLSVDRLAAALESDDREYLDLGAGYSLELAKTGLE
jgi:hypothetical protein